MVKPVIWSAVNNSAVCSQGAGHSACAPSVIAFLSLITQLLGRSKDNYPPVVNEDVERNEYDFIVVGAGSAGCVLANRLTEIKNWKVLLLEAGTNEPGIPDVPSFSLITHGSSIDWTYRTQPGKAGCLAKRNGGCPWPRGKVMGGSSTINQLIYIRGHPKDYDNWAKLGNTGWSYEDVLPYFRKSENNRNPEVVAANPRYHGVGGYQDVEYFPYLDKNTNVLLDALQEIGYPLVDVNGANHTGSTRYQFISRNGQRQSTNGAFIRKIIHNRPNLTIKTRSYVTKLIIDPDTKQAVGVEYVQTTPRGERITKTAYAKKEVIVSGGAINSPKLLMLSGIGPREELEKLGIKVIQDLAVGKNLQDHPTFLGFIIKLTKPHVATLAPPEQWAKDTINYIHNHHTLLGAMGVLSSGAFVQSPYEPTPDWADIQITFGGLNISDRVSLAEDRPGTANVPVAYYSGITVRPQVMAPRSRGYLVLNSTDPQWSAPLLYPHYFEDPHDLNVIVAGVRIGRKLFNTTAFRQNGFELLTDPMPACKHLEFDSDDYWRCAAMSYTDTNYHCVGTCKMGPASDPEAVVDPQLRVYGIKSLRVVDSSIFPVIMRGNTNAPTIMVAEKISDLIKETWLDNCDVKESITERTWCYITKKFKQVCKIVS